MGDAGEQPTDDDAKEGVGETMDIHKPKAAHSWREFAIEIGTIICGILIALSLEQGVEWLHHDHELRETRAAIRAEVADDAQRAEIGAREDRCTLGVLDRFEQWAKGGPRAGGSGHFISPIFTTTVWDGSQSGGVTRMPLEEKFADGRFYEGVRNIQGFVVIQRAQATRLSRYFALNSLNPAEARALLQDLSEDETTTHFKILNERNAVRQAAVLGVRPDPVSPEVRAVIAEECAKGGVPPPDFSRPLSPPSFAAQSAAEDLRLHD